MKLAACPVLAHETTTHLVCSYAADCGACIYFKQRYPKGVSWLCVNCIHDTPLYEDPRDYRKLLGYYQAGDCTSCGEYCIVLNAAIVRNRA